MSAEASGVVVVGSPMAATVVRLRSGPGERVRQGTAVVILESMKMEHHVEAPSEGTLVAVHVEPGQAVVAGEPLFELSGATAFPSGTTRSDPDHAPDRGPDERPELVELRARRAWLTDGARPEAVGRRHERGRRTARENVADLCDDGSFVEYGGLAIAAQRQRRSHDELVATTPADGLVGGIGSVNGAEVGEEAAPCAVLSYDYLVLAGTQGQMNHKKKDRLFEVVRRLQVPVVLFAEGGGGRPGDTDTAVVSGLDTEAFARFGSLSGLVPLVGVASGRCFAGNAALLGCCDVIIATPDANIGMGGPAMIEGGGLGRFAPEDIGPLAVQWANGVVDLSVGDDAAAVAAARRYLAYFQQRRRTAWEAPDPEALRHVIPAERRRAYDVHAVLEGLFDTGTALELRAGFAPGMVTALARLDGRSVGVLANNPMHLGGAIDADGADKAARFLQLCDAFDLPVVSLCDTPGFMVGPEAERTALVRHVSRMFVTGASLRVPHMTVIVRKGYGLGAQAMAAGGFHSPLLTVAWPTGELGGMGLEGAVQLGFRRELEAIEDPAARAAAADAMVAAAYEHGKAINVAEHFEIDDVIDPVETRHHLAAVLNAAPAPAPRAGKKRPYVDTW